MITPRLYCIINYVNSNVAADIGTDHAYVPIELIRSGKAKHVIASDVRKGPLAIAADHIKKYGMENKIDTRLGSGLSILEPEEADTIIVAGMGGELIEEIIRADEKTARASKLILQPMNSQYELRKYLIANGFTIEQEDIECEGHRVYNILIVKNGIQKPFQRDIDYHLPPFLYGHKNFDKLCEKKQREFKKIIEGLERSENCDTIRLEYFKNCFKLSEEKSVIS